MIHLSLLVLTIFLFTRQGSSQCCKNFKAGICSECPEKMHLYMGNCIFDITNCISYSNGLYCDRCKDGFTPSKEKTSCQRNGRLTNSKEQYFQLPLFDQVYKDILKILDQKVKQSRPNIAAMELYTAASTRQKENQKIRLIYSTNKGFLEVGFRLQNQKLQSREIFSSLYEIGPNQDYANLPPEQEDKIREDLMDSDRNSNHFQLIDCFKSAVDNQINFRVFFISLNEGLVVRNITKKVQRLQDGVSLKIQQLSESFNKTITQALRFKFLTKQFENAKLIKVIHIEKKTQKFAKNIYNLTYNHILPSSKSNNLIPTSYLLFQNVTETGKFQLIQYSIFNKTTRFEIYNGGQPTFQDIYNMTIQQNIRPNSITEEKVFYDIEKICNQKYEYETKNGAISRSGRGQNQTTILYQIQFDKIMPQNKSIISTFTFAIDIKNLSLGLLHYTVFQVSKMKVRKLYNSTRESAIKNLTGFTKTIYNMLRNQPYYDSTSKLISIFEAEYDSKTRLNNANGNMKRIIFTFYFPDSKNKYQFLRFRYDIIGSSLLILPNSLIPNQVFVNLDNTLIPDYNLTAIVFESVGKIDESKIQTVKRYQSKERIKVYRILLRFNLEKQIKQGVYQITPFESIELKLGLANLPPPPPPAPKQKEDENQSPFDIDFDTPTNTTLTQRQINLNQTFSNAKQFVQNVMVDKINANGLKFLIMRMMTNKRISDYKLQVFYMQYINQNFTSGYYFIVGILVEVSQIVVLKNQQLDLQYLMKLKQNPYFKQCCKCNTNETKIDVKDNKNQSLRRLYENVTGNSIKAVQIVQQSKERLVVLQNTGRQIEFNKNENLPKVTWELKQKVQNVSQIEQANLKKVISEITGDKSQVVLTGLNIYKMLEIDRITIQYQKMMVNKDKQKNSNESSEQRRMIVIFQAEKNTIIALKSKKKSELKENNIDKSNESNLKLGQPIEEKKVLNVFNLSSLSATYFEKTFFPNIFLQANQKQVKKYSYIPIRYEVKLNKTSNLRLNYENFQQPISLGLYNLPTNLIERYPDMLIPPFYKRSSNNSKQTIYICNHTKFGSVNIVFDQSLNEVVSMEFNEEGFYISDKNYFELQKYKWVYLAQKGVRILIRQIFEKVNLDFIEIEDDIYDPLLSWKFKTFNLVQMIETVYFVSGYLLKAESLVKRIDETTISITITYFENVSNKISQQIEQNRVTKNTLMDKVKETRQFKLSEGILKQKYSNFLAFSSFQNIVVIRYPSQIIFNVLYQTPYGILPASLLYNIKANISSILNFAQPKPMKTKKNLEPGCKSMSNTGKGCLQCEDDYILFRGRICFKKIKRCSIQLGDICFRCEQGFKKRMDQTNQCI